MSNSFVPFNFNPKANTYLTSGGISTFTIPAGEYALLSIASNLSGSQGVVTVDGTNVYKSGYIQSISGSNNASTTTPTLGGFSDGYGEIAYGTAAGSLTNFNDPGSLILAAGTTVGITQNYPIGPASFTIANASTANAKIYRGYVIRNSPEHPPAQIWVPSGAVVTISGGDICVAVQRFNIPS